MSWSFNGTRILGTRYDDASDNVPNVTTAIAFGCYYKPLAAMASQQRFLDCRSNTSPDRNQEWALETSASGLVQGFLKDVGTWTQIVTATAALTTNAWNLILCGRDTSVVAGRPRLWHGVVGGAIDEAITGTGGSNFSNWSTTEPMYGFAVGGRVYNNPISFSSLELANGLLAYPFIASVLPTDQQATDLLTQTPLQVLGANLVRYWTPDVTTDQVGGLQILLNKKGTSATNADNPSLSSGGGGGVPTLVQVERGHTLARGLGRGIY